VRASHGRSGRSTGACADATSNVSCTTSSAWSATSEPASLRNHTVSLASWSSVIEPIAIAISRMAAGARCVG
jgi:hypothetical protein